MNKILKKEIELLAPAGSYETFCAVVRAGADAVYLGGSQFGARAYANNFNEEELCKAIDFAHSHGVAVYLTVNTLFKERELEEGLYPYLLPYYKQGLDAVIVQDMGAIALIRVAFPDMDIHTSTQMTVTDALGASYMKSLGATRVVTAREMSLAEICRIKEQVDVEIESFVHGALCYCYSGQCLLSSMLGGRSGNRGRCAQPCRLPYEVYDADMHHIACKGSYVLSPKDLCTISAIPALSENGVYSFKIEGRMKQAEYAAGVVSVYRSYIDRYLDALNRARETGMTEADARKTAAEHYHVTKEDQKKLLAMGNRSGFTDGYYFRHNGKEMITFGRPGHTKSESAQGEEMLREVRRTYIEGDVEQSKEKIKGILRLKKDFPAILELEYGTCHVRTEGDVVQAALKQPLSGEKIESSMRKTGNTPFTFESINIDMDEAVFMPVQALNQLRRAALEELESQMYATYRRDEPKAMRGTDDGTRQNMRASDSRFYPENDVTAGRNVAVSVEQREQLSVILRKDYVDDIYLDSSCYARAGLFEALSGDVKKIHGAGKKAYYIMPAVFRRGTAAFYEKHLGELKAAALDGLVVKSYDALAFVNTYLGTELSIILDHSLYSWNTRAKEMLWADGVLRDTAPLELNRRELMERDNRGSEWVVYGYLPLMTSAQCVHANTGTCDKTKTVVYLKDRYGKYFPVKNNCTECYNTLYNTTPLILFAALEDADKMGMAGIRLCFTVEDEAGVEKVLSCYEQIVLQKRSMAEVVENGSYTNGHYKRGVE